MTMIYYSEKLGNTNKVFTFVQPNPPIINGLTKQLLPIFKLLRIIGRCPFSFEIEQDSLEDHSRWKKINYKLKVSLKETGFITFVLGVVFFNLMLILGFFQSGALGFLVISPGKIFPNRTNLRYETAVQGGKAAFPGAITLSYEYIYFVFLMAEYILMWWTSPMLLTWLNEWNSVEKDMRNCGHGQSKLFETGLTSFFNKFLIFYISIPTVVCGSFVSWDDIFPSHPIATFVGLVCSFAPPLCMHSEDVKIIMMFRTVEITIKQIKLGVVERYHRNMISSVGPPAKSEIREWTKIWIKIRKQADLTGKYIAVHQLISIGILTYFASSALFLTAYSFRSDVDKKQFGVFPIILSTMSLVRLICKVKFAVRISEEEKSLAVLLKDMEMLEENEQSQLQLKDVYEMITAKATEISLNNFVTLDNSLVLGIAGQVLTQFIVFMQFQG